MISLARSASLTTQPSASLASSRFGGFISKKRIPARALLRAVAIGCRISWDSEAANSPIVLTQLLTLVLRALALRHVDVCANDLEQRTERGKFMMGVCFDVFDCSVRQQDFELGKEISFLPYCLLDFAPQPFSIVRVNALPHCGPGW